MEKKSSKVIFLNFILGIVIMTISISVFLLFSNPPIILVIVNSFTGVVGLANLLKFYSDDIKYYVSKSTR